ncbi:NAD(P)/FAD-dependent oxidoreductase [Bacillus sp. V3B]|uniref:NAD(P)/FAD-dependent oxidoreductase n=1 Tax=Bacillus sp. V3B TaxID=2804915 RepID=UPI0021092B89|nr:NAD(P)/FAD-dependent oxidoreductase [Bacillus sp. V3B]MCQ6276531.1 NAD(P)/FAD-dependent oxidoreductase [Bacillus sp. V3B]
MKKPKIVILGAGFGGLMTIVTLQKELGAGEADIILVNKHDYHYQRTWLHQAAAGNLHPNRVRFDIKKIIDHDKVQFIQDTVIQIRREEKKVILEENEISYDYLVMALGGQQETLGVKGIKENTLSISSINAARRISNHIESQFASYQKGDEKLTIVVGGAGLTGMEFLGELTDRIPKLCRQYRVGKEKVKLICIQSSYALSDFDRSLSEYAVSYLEGKGVQFIFGIRIKECTPDGVLIGKKDEEQVKEVKAGTVIWAGGVRGNSIIEGSGIETMKGRVKVEPDLRAPESDNLFIIGDCSLVIDEKKGTPYSPTAQIALQQGITCARNIVSLIHNETELETFVPHIRGIICSLGKESAVGTVYGKNITGAKALFMKKMIDNRALYMIGGSSLILKKGRFKLI